MANFFIVTERNGLCECSIYGGQAQPTAVQLSARRSFNALTFKVGRSKNLRKKVDLDQVFFVIVLFH
jgi:hypothetical protein